MMDWKILKVGDKYEVHNEFGYWTEFDSYADASCWVKDKNEEFKRDCERARKHKNEQRGIKASLGKLLCYCGRYS